MSQPRELTYTAAALEAVVAEMRRQPELFTLGQIVGPISDSYYPGIGVLVEEFGEQRVRPTGIIERFVAGAGVGAALAGGRCLVDMSRSQFASLAYDEIFAKGGLWRYEHGSNGDMQLPVVFRMTCDTYGTHGAEHARILTGLFMSGIGLQVAVPSTPYDAKGLMATALRSNDPVVFMQHAQLFRKVGDVPEEEYTIPFGQAVVRRPGSDCTIVAVSYMVELALDAADLLAGEGVEVEVIDPRTLTPLDTGSIVSSVSKTGRLIVVDEDYQRCGVASEIGFQVQEEIFDLLEAPIGRVSNPNVPVPNAPSLKNVVLPSASKIVAAVKTALDYRRSNVA